MRESIKFLIGGLLLIAIVCAFIAVEFKDAIAFFVGAVVLAAVLKWCVYFGCKHVPEPTPTPAPALPAVSVPVFRSILEN